MNSVIYLIGLVVVVLACSCTSPGSVSLRKAMLVRSLAAKCEVAKVVSLPMDEQEAVNQIKHESRLRWLRYESPKRRCSRARRVRLAT